MCGIFGIISTDFRCELPRDYVRRAVKALAHRGPDALGETHGAWFSLGHARLSVLDLSSAANQPFYDASRQLCISYNGEIYNYRELRDELIQLGRVFRTDSDTEVLIQAYDEWGMDYLHRLNGIFAFGLVDLAKRRSFLVRDRLGVKPLYYGLVEGQLVFGSEPKSILQHPGYRAALNLDGVASYFALRYTAGDLSMFQGVKQVPAGNVLRCDESGLRLAPYWSLQPVREKPIPMEPRALRELIGSTVRRQSISDVPLSLMLSGGLDSSILLYEFASQGTLPECFTARVEESGYDESDWARSFAVQLGASHNAVEVGTLQSAHEIRQLIRKRDHPLGMHNEVALSAIARAISKRAKVTFCGEGSDELFAGYGRIFRFPYDNRRSSWLRWLPNRIGAQAATAIGCEDIFRGRTVLDAFVDRYAYFPPRELLPILRPRFADAIACNSVLRARLAEALGTECPLDISSLSRFFLQTHLQGLLLMLDGATMSHGLEARVPFADHLLVEKVMRLPDNAKLKWRSPWHAARALLLPVSTFSERMDETKSVLRKAYGSVLPTDILTRRKLGFPTPLHKWLTGRTGLAENLLMSKSARLNEFFDGSALRVWYQSRCHRPDTEFGRRVWLLCNFELFLQEYF